MASLWVAGARPRTLPAAVAPVAVGFGVAVHEDGFVWWKGLLALLVALALQVGTNYANDYSDGIRGTDEVRVGPVRLVGQQLKAPRAVRRAAFVAFGVAAAAGVALAITTAWWLLLVGAAAIAAGWFYTGGPRPYGYAGFGEVSVFVFFGLVATAGTAFVQTEQLTALAGAAGVPMGAMACALLVVNNLRDIPTDTAAGKRTLAVRLGDAQTRRLYVGLLWGALFVAVLAALVVADGPRWALPVFGLAYIPMIGPQQHLARGATGRDLVPVLQATSIGQLVLAGAMALTLMLG